MLSKRQISLIELILKNPQGIYASKLCEQLHVSTRTIRNDVASINLYLVNNHCMINSSKKTGYFIMAGNIEKIKECLSLLEAIDQKQIASSPTERRFYLLGRLIFEEEVSISEAADELYVTEATLNKDINALIKQLKEQYDFHLIEFNNGQLKLCASEKEIRSLFYRIVIERINLSNKLMDLALFQLVKDVLNLEELNELVEYFHSYFGLHSLNVSDLKLSVTAWMVYFTSLRSDCGHHLDKEETNSVNNTVFSFIQSANEELHLEFDVADCALLSAYIDTLRLGELDGSDHRHDDIIQEFFLEVYERFDLDFVSMPTMRSNLEQHLEFAIKRLLMDYQMSNPILQEVKIKYAFAYEIALLVVPIIYKKYKKFLKEDEVSFLALYIQPFLQAEKSSVNTLIVHESTMSYVHLIENWLHHEFGDKIHVVGSSNIHTLEEAIAKNNAELVLSSALLEKQTSVPVINIFRLPTEKDRDEIERFISNHAMRYQGSEIFHSVFSTANVVLFQEECDFETALYECAKRLKQSHAIEDAKEYYELSLQREKVYPTHIAQGCYMPHPLINDALKTSICIAVCKNNLDTSQTPAQLLFVSAFEPKIEPELRLIYKLIHTIASAQPLVSMLLESTREQEVLTTLEHIMQMIS